MKNHDKFKQEATVANIVFQRAVYIDLEAEGLLGASEEEIRWRALELWNEELDLESTKMTDEDIISVDLTDE